MPDVKPRGSGSNARPRRSRRGVHTIDRIAEMAISAGGFAVLAAVLGIGFYLVWNVLPMFSRGEARGLGAVRLSEAMAGPAAATSDESGRVVGVVRGGRIVFLLSESGGEVASFSLDPEGAGVGAVALRPGVAGFAVGYDDGAIRTGTIEFDIVLPADVDLRPEERALAVGGAVVREGGVTERTPAGEVRRIVPRVTLGQRLALAKGSGGVTHVDLRDAPDRRLVVTRRADGTMQAHTIRSTRPLGGGAPRERLASVDLTSVRGEIPEPRWLLATGDGAGVLHVSGDGTIRRFSIESGEAPLREVAAATGGVGVTAAAMLTGGQTLVLGAEDGAVTTHHIARDPVSPAEDARRVVRSGAFRVGSAAVVSIAPGPRDRTAAFADADGAVLVRHMTSGRTLALWKIDASGGVAGAIPTPRGDGVLAFAGDRLERAGVSSRHADVSLRTLFGAVHYEGELEPGYVYQTGSGAGGQSKHSLIPLMFGTLKATLAAMVFAVPIAVLGALYTSEFMSRRLRRVVKPGIELMASLPSVVLGFLAAIVLAPIVRDRLPAILVGLVVVPAGMLVLAHAWQMLPWRLRARFGNLGHLAVVAAALLGLCGAALAIGPMAERTLFRPTADDQRVAAGLYDVVPEGERPGWVGRRDSMSADDERALRRVGMYFRDGVVVRPRAGEPAPNVIEPSVRAWMDGGIGSAWPGWFVLLVLPSAVVLWIVRTRAWPSARAGRSSREGATVELVWCVGVLAAGVLVSAFVSSALTAMGLDARDVVFGPYSQRNTFVVGLVMALAVIPIIYTISEDALQSVPPSLRSASLGVGATPWQTAMRIVLPAAGSGVFSACMIGLGRAVGETMIVLMATGNTAQMGGNIFAGVRTLSANIAVELPEAPPESSHYRILFVCALVLFAFTFLINTTAEVVRLRFRKRSASL